MAELATCRDCYARWDGTDLVLGNACLERTWRFDACGRPTPVSLLDKAAGREWLARPSPSPAPLPGGAWPEEPRRVTVAAGPGRDPVAAESLEVTAAASGETTAAVLHLSIRPGVPAVQGRLEVRGAAPGASGGAAGADPAEATGVELADQARRAPLPGTDCQELLLLAPPHLRLVQSLLFDRTDLHNELLQEREWLLHPNERCGVLTGNLFRLEETRTGDGLILLKEAPLPESRPVASPLGDLRFSGAHAVLHRPPGEEVRREDPDWPPAYGVGLYGHAPDPQGCGYAWTVLTCRGRGPGATAALQAYQRARRPYVPERDGRFLSNTWGDRSRDARIRADFIAGEIRAGAELGVDVIQIDDGWMRGATSNSVRAAAEGGVWEGFHARDPEFWAVDRERFPDGLAPLVAAAREKGMRFGLWFGPDSAEDFAHWQADAETLLRLWRELGVRYVKLDGIKARTRAGEANLHRFFRAVLEGSEGAIVMDLDVTAEVRPGYWGAMGVGPIFVENRYTDFRRWWPHHTLRNVWQLARVLPPARLRMEVLNHARNRDRYLDDPFAPAAYRPDYLFATVMLTSPLGWFEMQHLPTSYPEEMGPLVRLWKEHRERLHRGTVYPVGAAPDGTAWTGFATVDPDGDGGYLLVFRETNERERTRLDLPPLPGRGPAVRLAGEGEAVLEAGGAELAIPAPRRFLFARYEG